jgi:hypothetical protein
MKAVLTTLYFLGLLAQVVIRVPHERRRRKIRMAVERVDTLEQALVGLLFVGLYLSQPSTLRPPGWTGRTTACHRRPGKAPAGLVRRL